MPRPSISEIQEFFVYNPMSGHIIWRKASNYYTKIGDIAGYTYKGKRSSYIRTSIHKKPILAHHVAFVLMTGSYPKHNVDHINGDGTDNKWINLRDVTHSENLRNQKLGSANTSGIIGVDFCKKTKLWRARIKLHQKEYHLGSFQTKLEAATARKKAEKDFNFHENHGRDTDNEENQLGYWWTQLDDDEQWIKDNL